MNATPADANAYEHALRGLRDASAALDDVVRTVVRTATRLQDWPHASAGLLIESLPREWPDSERLVAALAEYGRAVEMAREAWRAVAEPLQRNLVSGQTTC